MAEAAAAPPGSPASLAERFSRGEPVAVEVDKIERAFADLWKAASASGEGTVSRAALWNVVVPTRAQDLERTRKVVDELAPLMPARVLVLVEEPETAERSGDDVRATIESNLVARSSGARVVYSEEITLRGRRGDAHFGSLVRALLLPGLPTATLWTDPTMPEALLRRQLLAATDRLVLDTGACTRPRQLIELQRCAELASAMPVTDLGWLRLKSFRLLFAGMFDAPVGGAPLHAARAVTIHHRAGCESSAFLLAAWLASTLGWLFAAAEAAEPGVLRFRFDRPDKAGASVTVTLRAAPGECGTSGIVGLELDAGDEQLFGVRRTEQNHAALSSPIAPPRVIKLDSRRDAELCLAALGPAGRDPLFGRCLALASRLASATTG
ncbi:MAG TPA: glucose-6-phosphate dehydrogenase assembly protein OpcA [Polyangia bacterium]|nr:glucose-6-phosphate dehydrogenase assembly protein OpcA [Polyangia bacterium]